MSAAPNQQTTNQQATKQQDGKPESTKVGDFLDQLASSAPTPGGGGAAALMGATAAALVSMVCNLTIGKKGYENVESELRQLLARSEALRMKLVTMMADDVEAFNGLMGAYRLPKDSDDDKARRSEAIQAGLKGATEAPLACARAAAELVRLSRTAAELGNKNVISDAGVAVLSAWAALRSAALNVDINAPQIKDRVYADAASAEAKKLLEECGPLSEQIHRKVVERMS